MTTSEHQAMERAIALSSVERPHPNPRVGAILLDATGAVIATGAHRAPGHPHAERVALDSLGAEVPDGSTMVVTLEPCNHTGRTSPCTDAIIDAGIRRVVVGAIDPDGRVTGTGVARLREAGVEVVTGVLADEVEAADPAYFHHRRTGRARVTVKTASTLDGQTAALDGTSQWITSVRARADGQLLRSEMDAVMVGAGTLRSDDPALTVRIDGYSGPQPFAVVVAGNEDLPANAQIWDRPGTVVVSTTQRDVPAEVKIVDGGVDGYPDPVAVAVALGDLGILNVLLEGGSRLLGSFWSAGVVDAGISYYGANLAGGTGLPMFSGVWSTLGEATHVEILSASVIGGDVRVAWVRNHGPVRN